MAEEKYNGFTNYETWNLKLWIDNEEPSYKAWRAEAREILAETPDKLQAVADLRDRLQEDTEAGAPEMAPSFYCDALGAALGRVNYYEIAEMIIDEVIEDGAGK